MCHIWLIFVFLIEMRFHHAGHADLKLLTSGDPPTLAFQSAGIIGVSHSARPRKHNLILCLEGKELDYSVNSTNNYHKGHP